jgi:CDP-glycerol glycerophosphotransferase
LLVVVQNGPILTIEGRFKPEHSAPPHIVLVSRDEGHDVARFEVESDGPAFSVSIDVAEIDGSDDSTIDFYFVDAEEAGRTTRTRVGRFARMPDIVADEVEGLGAYYTVKGNLSLDRETTRPLPAKLTTRSLVFSGGIVELTATLETFGAPLKSALAAVNTRETHGTYESVVLFESRGNPETAFGLHAYELRTCIDCTMAVTAPGTVSDILDIVVEIETEWITSEPVRFRVEAPRYRMRRRLKPYVEEQGETTVVLIPYFTTTLNRLAVRVEVFDSDSYRYMKHVAWSAPIHRLRGRIRGTWLMGELPYKAQDNSMRLFLYTRGAHPNRRVFYVMDPGAPDAERLRGVGNVVAFRSREHIRLSVEAKRLIGTHHFHYILPTLLPWFDHRVRGIRVFLQHGIAGPKNMTSFYGANAGLDPDYFIVNSAFEREIVINDYGYRPSQVVVTGFPRFDSLLAPADPPKRQILVMPTWRDWLFTRDDVLESQFYAEWSRFLCDAGVGEELRERNVTVVVVLHPNMRSMRDLFQFDGVVLVESDQVDIQQLLKESSALVTDYSSIGFDFALLHRPVFYYMFDRERFNRVPSHMDVFSDMPGPVVNDVPALVAAVVDSADQDFAPRDEYIGRADRLLDHRDRGSSERVYQTVKHARRKVHLWNRLVTSDMWRTSLKHFRRTVYHEWSMQALFRMARALPRKRTVLFESGLGRQYAGNPKYIYERLVERGEAAKSVWVLDSTQRMKDATTRKVARKTPGFYWHLGRAKVWVTDQHFPHGLTPPRGTGFIQTWHGTPLKRMWFDLEEIRFQPDDYVEKGAKRLAYWDVLLAQSEYAASIFRSAFRFTGKMITEGYPRNDILVGDEADRVEAVRKRVGVPNGKRVVLYAPTFRDDERAERGATHDMELDFARFGEVLGNDHFLLVRTHMFVHTKRRTMRRLEGIGADVSGYDDMQELLMIADILVTDYSSVLFDFAVTGRPMIFFAYDLDHYRDDLRGFYLDYEEEMPGPIVRSSDEVIEAIRSVDAWKDEYVESLERFRMEFCPHDDGMASERVIDRLREEGWL